MKKTVACLMIMAVIATTVFFYAPVNAASTPQYVGEKHNSESSNGVTFYMRATQYADVVGSEIFTNDSNPGVHIFQAYTPVVVTYRIFNGTNKYKTVTNPYLDLYTNYSNWNYGLGLSIGVTEIINYSQQLVIGHNYTNGTSMTVMCADDSNGFTGSMILPPYSTYTGIAEIRFNAIYQVQGTIITNGHISLDSIQNYTTPTVTDTSDTIVSGITGSSSVTNSKIDEVIAAIEDETSTLEDIRDLLSWSGSFPTITYSGSYYQRYTGTLATDITWQAEVSYNGCSLNVETVDFEPPDDIYTNQEFIHQYTVYLRILNNTGGAVNAESYFLLNGLYSSTSHRTEVLSFESDVFTTPYLDTRYGDFYFYVDKEYQTLSPSYSRFVLILNFYTNSSTRPSLGSPALSYGDTLTVHTDDVTENGDTVNDQADQIAQQVENVHQQEMQYFQDNQDAIEATGLNNFQFNQNHISAFTMITNQFTELWNALGDYTLVFIFTLLLSLATYIIKHEPTTKVKQYRSSVAAERAERISYYAHKNAQARANSAARNDGDSYFWDAVRRNNS